MIQLVEEKHIPNLLLMVDFEKAFNSISWKYMDKILLFFNFGPYIRSTIKTLDNNASLCVIQHGIFSEFFNIKRGCRQGDPVSLYLFILCVEILGAMIRQNKEVKGIKFGEIEYKIMQYADDTALTLDGSEVSLRKTLNLLDEFAKFSGLKPNINKTKCIWIGSEVQSKNKLLHEKELQWIDEPFTFLGIIFSTNIGEIPNMNYSKKIQELTTSYSHGQKGF